METGRGWWRGGVLLVVLAASAGGAQAIAADVGRGHWREAIAARMALPTWRGAADQQPLDEGALDGIQAFADCGKKTNPKDCSDCCSSEGKAAERVCQLTAGLAGATGYLAGGPVAGLIVGAGVRYLCLKVADAGTRKCLLSCTSKVKPGGATIGFY